MDNTVELTEEDLADPGVAFAKLAGIVLQMRQDMHQQFAQTRREVAQGVARTAPDYRDELKGILTALKGIQEKPALSVHAGALEAASREGATRGAGEAVDALRAAAAAYRQAQEREASLLEKFEAASWQYYVFAGIALVLLGMAGGFMVSGNLAKEIPVATVSACKQIGGAVTTDQQSKRPVCSFWVNP